MSRAAGCFKYGCLGCLVLVLGSAAIMGVIGYGAATAEHRVERRELSRPIPASSSDLELPVIDAPDGLLGDDAPARPLDLSTEAPPTELSAGIIKLDLDLGELEVSAGEAGEPIRVIADYDVEHFELTEIWSESDPGEGWSYTVKFKPKHGFLGMLVVGDDLPARIEVVIPPDVLVDLVGTLGVGQSRAELGGLWLRDVHLDLGAGDHRVSFDRPTREPLASLHLNKSVGEFRIESLGNASPRETWLQHRMGELVIDLAGEWKQDSTIEAGLLMGALILRTPDNAHVDVARADVSIGEKRLEVPRASDLPADAPTLTLELKNRIGEIRVD